MMQQAGGNREELDGLRVLGGRGRAQNGDGKRGESCGKTPA
jgi:hypothetical protein